MMTTCMVMTAPLLRGGVFFFSLAGEGVLFFFVFLLIYLLLA